MNSVQEAVPIIPSNAYSWATDVVSAVHGGTWNGMPFEDMFGVQYDENWDRVDGLHPEFFRKAAKPHKDTLLHAGTRSIITLAYDYATGHYAPSLVPSLHELFSQYNIAIPTWLTERKVERHISSLDNIIEQRLVPHLTNAVFYLLFNDRDFLLDFQMRVAGIISALKKSDFDHILESDGIIKRQKHLPVWLKNAVFHRDKGRCQHCGCDLTGIAVPLRSRQLHFDHIVPLAASGSNDPTNYQLLCESCNSSKRDATIPPAIKTFPYW